MFNDAQLQGLSKSKLILLIRGLEKHVKTSASALVKCSIALNNCLNGIKNDTKK